MNRIKITLVAGKYSDWPVIRRRSWVKVISSPDKYIMCFFRFVCLFICFVFQECFVARKILQTPRNWRAKRKKNNVFTVFGSYELCIHTAGMTQLIICSVLCGVFEIFFSFYSNNSDVYDIYGFFARRCLSVMSSMIFPFAFSPWTWIVIRQKRIHFSAHMKWHVNTAADTIEKRYAKVAGKNKTLS